MSVDWIPDHRFARINSPIISLGAARSGKSTLARIASSFRNVDHVDEPFALLALSIGLSLSNISARELRKPMRCIVAELHNETALLRTANFRFHDASSIWRSKRWSEIASRLLKLKSRSDAANFLIESNYVLWLTLTEQNTNYNFFRQSFPSAPILLTVRHPLAVAIEIANKGWFRDATLQNPAFNTPSYVRSTTNGTRYLPWWLPESEQDAWLRTDELTRGLIYWRLMHTGVDWELLVSMNKILIFRFDEIFCGSTELTQRLSKLLQRPIDGRIRRMTRNLAPIETKGTKLSRDAIIELEGLAPLIDGFDL